MTPLDRAALADALASASPETLREDAARFERIANVYDRIGKELGNCALTADTVTQVPTYRRLAALALACADLEENGRSVLFGITKTGRVVLIDEDGAGYTAKGDTLPAALAALLKGDQ